MQGKVIVAIGAFLIVVPVFLEVFSIGKEMSVTGLLVIPLVDLSLAKDDHHRIRVESENDGNYEFRILKSEVDKLLESGKSFGPSDPPANVTVKFKKTLLGRHINATVVEFKEGWIRTLK